MFLYGASGHSKVVIDIIRAIGNIDIESLYDDNPKFSDILGISVTNNKSVLEKASTCIVSIGNNAIRKKIAEKLNASFVTVIHPKSVIALSSHIDKGTVIMAGAIINADARIGKHCIINTGAVIDHDCILNDYIHISPNTVLAGNVTVGEGTHVGIGACVIPGIKIGKWVTIGAGAVIIKDIPDYAVVVGNPGKVIKFNLVAED